ncbi:MAG: hypothetical protein HYZ91_02700, partial [Candidatus Omnitrophica bacterium]|nr:hypothetical protein [Candidatus Omnitrophota bacterium]
MPIRRLLHRVVPLKTRVFLVDWAHVTIYHASGPLLIKLACASRFFKVPIVTICSSVLDYLEHHDQDRVSDEQLASLFTHPDKYANPQL